MNTLVYHYGGLGDFITTLPAIALWKQYHQSSITLLGKPSSGELARNAEYADTIIDADCRCALPAFKSPPDHTDTDRFFRQFDAVLLYCGSDSPILANSREFFTGDIFWQPPFPAERVPVVEYHLSMFNHLRPFSSQRLPIITISPESLSPQVKTWIENNSPFVVIHPGSGSLIKNWPVARFIEVARQLREDGCSILWMRGPAEAGIEFPHEDKHLDEISLTECAAILSLCSVFLGNDSGVTHLAAATGCPVVALFGPSDSVIWGPTGRGPVCIIKRQLPCGPCHLHHDRNIDCGCKCMLDICTDHVIAELKNTMHR